MLSKFSSSSTVTSSPSARATAASTSKHAVLHATIPTSAVDAPNCQGCSVSSARRVVGGRTRASAWSPSCRFRAPPGLQILARILQQVSTAILSVTYRISSELRSQATAGLVSTTVGDHVGIRGAVGSLFFFLEFFRPCFVVRRGEQREGRRRPSAPPQAAVRGQHLQATGKTNGLARVRRGNEYRPVRLIFNCLASASVLVLITLGVKIQRDI